jgi:hypothetical protein
VAGCGECGDQPSGSCAMELVSGFRGLQSLCRWHIAGMCSVGRTYICMTVINIYSLKQS